MSHKRRPVEGVAAEYREKVSKRLAELIRRLRSEQDISQQDLSLELRRGPKYIWRIENCYSEIDLFEFVEIMEALGVDPTAAMREIAGE